MNEMTEMIYKRLSLSKHDEWHGFKLGANCVTYEKVNYWNHNAKVLISRVVEEAEKEGFKVLAKGDDFLQVVFESIGDLNRFYSLVVSLE
jgi:hypothetical protein